MNLMNTNTKNPMCLLQPGLSKVCRALKQKVLEQISHARESILEEFQHRMLSNEHLLKLALNEAESLAWQTRYPHLLFPALAEEKAEAVAAWKDRQQYLLRRPEELAA